jgi:hypothetical protein
VLALEVAAIAMLPLPAEGDPAMLLPAPLARLGLERRLLRAVPPPTKPCNPPAGAPMLRGSCGSSSATRSKHLWH